MPNVTAVADDRRDLGAEETPTEHGLAVLELPHAEREGSDHARVTHRDLLLRRLGFDLVEPALLRRLVRVFARLPVGRELGGGLLGFAI